MERDDSRGFVAVVNCCLGGGGPATWGQPCALPSKRWSWLTWARRGGC